MSEPVTLTIVNNVVLTPIMDGKIRMVVENSAYVSLAAQLAQAQDYVAIYIEDIESLSAQLKIAVDALQLFNSKKHKLTRKSSFEEALNVTIDLLEKQQEALAKIEKLGEK